MAVTFGAAIFVSDPPLRVLGLQRKRKRLSFSEEP
jgi:hypothetical protein